MEHVLIPPFSSEWWTYNFATIIVIITIIYTATLLRKKSQNILTLSLASIFIFEFIFMDFYHIFIDKTWSLEHSLPLHLCGLMWFMCIYLFITKKQWVFEMILFIGMPGGIHSLLTPELPHGADLLHKIDFFIGHGGLILAPFYAIFILGMWPRKNAWWKSFIKLQILVLIIGLTNWAIGGEANYMYLMQTPIADNPLIPSENSFFGKWPYYILIFEIAVLIHALLIYTPFFLMKKKESKLNN